MAPLEKHLTEHEHEQSQLLTNLLKYVKQGARTATGGRALSDNACALYWPHFVQSTRMLSELGNRVLTPFQFHHAFREPDQALQSVRHAVVKLVAPLILDPALPSGSLAREFAETRGIAFDATDFTVFRRMRRGKRCCAHPYVFPQANDEIPMYEQYVPEAIRLLYYAWHLVTRRLIDMYDPLDIGVDHASNGYIFINWLRFKESDRWPRWARLDPRQIDAQLYHFHGRLNLKPGLIPAKKSIPASSTRIEQRLFARETKNFVRLCEETDTFTYNPNDSNSLRHCTLVSPLYLRRKEYLFDGRWYAGRDSQGRRIDAAKPREGAHVTLEGNKTVKLARVESITFRPMQWLDGISLSDGERWFPENHEELIWVNRRHDIPAFTRPRILTNNNPACAPEFKVWLLTTDWMKLVETFFEDGRPGNMHRQCKSDYFRRLRDEHLTQLGRRCIEGFVSLDELSNKQLKHLYARAPHEYLAEHPESTDGTRWYTELIREASEARLRIPEVCRKLRVILPSVSKDVRTEPFFMPTAIRLFEKVALASFNVLDDSVENDFMLRNMLDFSTPAPLLLAWARMCRAVEQGSVSSQATRRSAKLWSPDEDFHLVLNYKSKPGRTSLTAWRKIEAETGRGREACRQRVGILNRQLKQILDWEQYEEHRIGGIREDEIRARRIVLLTGVYAAIKRHKERVSRSHPGVARVMAFSPERLLKHLPPSAYRHEFFHRLL